jgi:hypothetical protein
MRWATAKPVAQFYAGKPVLQGECLHIDKGSKKGERRAIQPRLCVDLIMSVFQSAHVIIDTQAAG